jgi:hypothetical protein
MVLSKSSMKGRMLAGSSRRTISQRCRNSSAISAETSRDQPSAVLKLTTRTGFLYWPLSRSKDGLVIRHFRIGLAPDSADLAEIIDNQINILRIARDDRRDCGILTYSHVTGIQTG